MKPTAQDLEQYSHNPSEHPHHKHPERFLKIAQRVRAKLRVFDLPNVLNPDSDWGPVHAEIGELGTVIHLQEGHWPAVRFDRTGTITDVTDFEVEPLPLA